jgi:hypothetical protein
MLFYLIGDRIQSEDVNLGHKCDWSCDDLIAGHDRYSDVWKGGCHVEACSF